MDYNTYLYHEKRRIKAEQRRIKRLQREEEKRIQREEEEAMKHLEEEMEQLRADIKRDITEIFRKYEKQKEKEYYLTHPSWYLFKNTVTGELISIALTGDEKEEFLELIPALVKIEKRGPGLNPHEWPGYFNVKKIRTPHDD